MESTISTKDLKAKLDGKQGITVVETLAPERYREAHIPGALNIPPERIKELAPAVVAQQGRRDHHLLYEHALTRQRIRRP
jgi:rhodanese-related sulfurtransferase